MQKTDISENLTIFGALCQMRTHISLEPTAPCQVDGILVPFFSDEEAEAQR